jgi:cytochrome d ubiquinol oxidase subunit I
VQDLLLTKDAASGVAPHMIGFTLAGYLALYVVLLTAFISTLFYMARNANKKEAA